MSSPRVTFGLLVACVVLGVANLVAWVLFRRKVDGALGKFADLTR